MDTSAAHLPGFSGFRGSRAARHAGIVVVALVLGLQTMAPGTRADAAAVAPQPVAASVIAQTEAEGETPATDEVGPVLPAGPSADRLAGKVQSTSPGLPPPDDDTGQGDPSPVTPEPPPPPGIILPLAASQR